MDIFQEVLAWSQVIPHTTRVMSLALAQELGSYWEHSVTGTAIIIHVHVCTCGVCCVALPCCLFDLACFFLSSFSSLIETCTCDTVCQ